MDQATSPVSPSGSRLVARTRAPAAACSSRSVKRATASTTCSQLSKNVYEVIPTTAFGIGTDETFGATRWRF